jgi:hypothetical protein
MLSPAFGSAEPVDLMNYNIESLGMGLEIIALPKDNNTEREVLLKV